MAIEGNLGAMDNSVSSPTSTPDHAVFGEGPIGLISGENALYPQPAGDQGHANMGKALAEMGLKAEPTRGRYGAHEPSYIVHGATIPQLQELGKRFGQESVAMRQNGKNFLIYVNGPKEGHATPPKEGYQFSQTEPDDFYTALPGPDGQPQGYFQYPMDLDNPAIPLHALSQHLNPVDPNQAADTVLKSVVEAYHNILLDIRTRELAKAQVGENVAQHQEPGIHEKSGKPHTEPGIHEKPAEAARPVEKSMKDRKVFDLVKGQVEKFKKGCDPVLKAEDEGKSSWDRLHPDFRSEHEGWSKAGEFHCPHCKASIGKNLKGAKPHRLASEHLKDHKMDKSEKTSCCGGACKSCQCGCGKCKGVEMSKSEAKIALMATLTKGECIPDASGIKEHKAPGSGGQITKGKLKKEEMPGAAPKAPTSTKPPAPKAPTSSKPAGVPGAPKPPQAPGATPTMHKAAMSMGPAKEAQKDQAVGTPTTGQAPTAAPVSPVKAAVEQFRPASPGAAGGMPKAKSPAGFTGIKRGVK